jgi:hypothetical protein
MVLAYYRYFTPPMHGCQQLNDAWFIVQLNKLCMQRRNNYVCGHGRVFRSLDSQSMRCGDLMLSLLMTNMNRLLACAITQGGPGIWALHVIGMCAMSWSAPVNVVYHPGYTIGGLVIAIVATFISFQFALLGYTRNKEMMEASSTGIGSHQQHTGQKAAAAARSGESGGKKYEAERTQTVTITENTRWSHIKRRRINELASDRSILGQLKLLAYRVNVWFLFSGVMLSLGTVLSHAMVTIALPRGLGADVNPTLSSIYFVIGTPLFMFAMLQAYYFFPQANVRFSGK